MRIRLKMGSSGEKKRRGSLEKPDSSLVKETVFVKGPRETQEGGSLALSVWFSLATFFTGISRICM